MKFDLHLFFPTATVIGLNKSRDLYQPIAVNVEIHEERVYTRLGCGRLARVILKEIYFAKLPSYGQVLSLTYD